MYSYSGLLGPCQTEPSRAGAVLFLLLSFFFHFYSKKGKRKVEKRKFKGARRSEPPLVGLKSQAWKVSKAADVSRPSKEPPALPSTLQQSASELSVGPTTPAGSLASPVQQVIPVYGLTNLELQLAYELLHPETSLIIRQVAYSDN